MAQLCESQAHKGVVFSLCLIGGALLPSALPAQTVTVDPTGAADNVTIFNDLQAAINSFATGGVNNGKPAPDVINVRSDHGAVVGRVNAVTPDSTGNGSSAPISLNEDLTIQGVDASSNPALAVFAGLPIANADQTIRNNAFPAFVWRQPVNLTLKNLAFIPAANPSGSPINSFMAVKAPAVAGVNTNINIENCVFTANDGNNKPITTTGRPEDDDKLSDPNVIGMSHTYGPCGIWAFSRQERGDLTLNMTDTVFASFATLTGLNPRAEAIKMWMNGAPTGMINMIANVNEGCVFANIDGSVAQVAWGSMIRMKGTESKPVVVRNLKNPNPPAAVWLYYEPADDQPVVGEFAHVHFHDIVVPAIQEGGVLGNGAGSYINFIENCVFADSPNDALTLRSKPTAMDSTTGLAKPELIIDNSVFHNVGSGAFPSALYSTTAFERPVKITRSYFTDADQDMTALYNNSTVSVWDVSDTVLSQTPPTALLYTVNGPGVINLGTNVTHGAVDYLNTTDPFSPDFYRVVAAVADWTLY